MNDLPELLTAQETIRYLRLDADERDPVERLRTLIRRQRLPVIRRGRLQLFRRSAIDDWLAAGARGFKMPSPARLPSITRESGHSAAARNGRGQLRSSEGQIAREQPT
jgi:hypothetical protein